MPNLLRPKRPHFCFDFMDLKQSKREKVMANPFFLSDSLSCTPKNIQHFETLMVVQAGSAS